MPYRMLLQKAAASANFERAQMPKSLAMITTSDSCLLGVGLYTLPRAARLIGADVRAVRRWLLGYKRLYKGEERISPPLWKTELVDADLPDVAIGFRDLLELRLVNAFAQHGVDLRVIRATANAAREMFSSPYPLTMKRFLTDGRRIFAEAVEMTGETSLIEPMHGQYLFSDIVKPSLYAGIEYEGETALKWYPIPGRHTVVLDPQLQFGAPIVADVAIPTDTLYAAFKAEERDRNVVAKIFDIDPRHVDAAVHFEERLAA